MNNLFNRRSLLIGVCAGAMFSTITGCKDYPISPKDDKPEEPTDTVSTFRQGLIGHYSFDENVRDTSVLANHALDYTDGIYSEGVNHQALFFDGTDDYLQLENTIGASKPLSFSFWVNSQGPATSTENNGAIISKHSWHRKSFYITTFGYKEDRNMNRIHASLFSGDGSESKVRDWANTDLTIEEIQKRGEDETQWSLVEPTSLALDEWTHVVVNTNDSTLSIFLDGKLTVSKERAYASYYDSSEPTYIGNIFNGGEGSNNHFHGYMDELRIYNRSLTTDEIETLYQDRI